MCKVSFNNFAPAFVTIPFVGNDSALFVTNDNLLNSIVLWNTQWLAPDTDVPNVRTTQDALDLSAFSASTLQQDDAYMVPIVFEMSFEYKNGEVFCDSEELERIKAAVCNWAGKSRVAGVRGQRFSVVQFQNSDKGLAVVAMLGRTVWYSEQRCTTCFPNSYAQVEEDIGDLMAYLEDEFGVAITNWMAPFQPEDPVDEPEDNDGGCCGGCNGSCSSLDVDENELVSSLRALRSTAAEIDAYLDPDVLREKLTLLLEMTEEILADVED